MLQTRTIHARPQDKYGLLRHMRAQALDSVMAQLEQILIDFDVYTILDCACGDGLYTAALAGSGRSVSAADDSPDAEKLLRQRLAERGDTVPFRQADLFSMKQVYPETFDAILCLDDALTRYANTDDAIVALRSRLNKHGVLIIGLQSWKELAYQGEAIAPLLLGEEREGTRYSMIRYIRHDAEMEWVDTKYIYHIEDPAGNVAVDWEEEQYTIHGEEPMVRLIVERGGYVFQTVQAGGQRLYSCGNELPRKRMGPAYYFQYMDDID